MVHHPSRPFAQDFLCLHVALTPPQSSRTFFFGLAFTVSVTRSCDTFRPSVWQSFFSVCGLSSRSPSTSRTGSHHGPSFFPRPRGRTGRGGALACSPRGRLGRGRLGRGCASPRLPQHGPRALAGLLMVGLSGRRRPISGRPPPARARARSSRACSGCRACCGGAHISLRPHGCDSRHASRPCNATCRA